MRAACSFLRQHSRRRDCGVTISEIFQNFFTTPNADLPQALRRKRRIAHHRLPDKVTMPQFFAEEYAVFCRGA
jgi:hypothetical protein